MCKRQYDIDIDIITVISSGIYGELGIEEFHKIAKEQNIYTDHMDSINRITDDKEYDALVERMVTRSEGTGVSTVVLFCSLQHMQGITEAAQRNPKASKFVWIASDSLDTAIRDKTKICILTIQLTEKGLSESFVNYFKKLNMLDEKWKRHVVLIKFWEDWFKCRLENNPSSSSYNQSCSGKESMYNVTQGFTLQPVMSVVYAFAHALDSLQKELCPNQSGICPNMASFRRERLLQHLRNVSFENFLNTNLTFNANGEVMAMYQIFNFHQVGSQKSYELIGWWDGQKSAKDERLVLNPDDVMWFEAGNGSIPQSYCSAECEFGYVRQQWEGYPFEYCWKCHKCDKLQLIVDDKCVTGPPGYIPNAKRDMWIKRELRYLKWTNTASIIIAVVSVISMIGTLAVLLIFLKYRNNPTVKASARELSCIILTGIFLCFIIPFIFIAKPTDLVCAARQVTPGIALTMIYSALFMKINRVYRVFTSAKTTKQRPPLVRPKSQILITFGLIAVQILITLLGLLTHITRATETYYSAEEKLVLECQIESKTYFGSISYVVVLMMLSTVYAFKTRKFPRNFNESKYIGITLYITLATTVLFFAFYLNTHDTIVKSALCATGMLLLGLITLLGLFSQRLVVIFCVKEALVNKSFIAQPASSEMAKSPVIVTKNEKPSTPGLETVLGNEESLPGRSVSF